MSEDAVEDEYEEEGSAYEEHYQRPADEEEPYNVTDKKGRDPWKDSLPKRLFSWAFWLMMFYFSTAGFIYGLMTKKDGTSNAMADTVFMPAEFARGWSFTYMRMTDWQISLFREAEEVTDDGNGL